MASLKVFVSSTCYDLNIVRTQLRSYLLNLGHDPVMSDYNDVLFDPRNHTHESCIKEIANADAVILIIGSRFGGTAIPKAINSLDIESLKNLSKGNKLLDTPNKISVTQLEIFKAIELGIPLFTFIDSKVLHDHLFYEKNKDKGILESLEFPSIEKKESAIFIFEFINFLRLRSKNNSIIEFSRLNDIEDYLKKQWSGLLQRLLFEQRVLKADSTRMDAFSEELKDIKSLILSSISTDQAKDVGRGVLKYRRLIDFLNMLEHPQIYDILLSDDTWEQLLKRADVKEIQVVNTNNGFRARVFLIKNDGTFYIARYTLNIIQNISVDWDSFKRLVPAVKQEVVNALTENFTHSSIGGPLFYKNMQFSDYLKDQFDSKEENNTTTTTINPNTINESKVTDDDE